MKPTSSPPKYAENTPDLLRSSEVHGYTFCGFCGKRIVAVSPKNGQRRKWCSKSCKNMNWQKRHRWCKNKQDFEKLKKSKPWVGKSIKCDVCGEQFKQTASHQKYCGKRCSRRKEYFVKTYGEDWKLNEARFLLAKELNKFKKELKDGKESRN